MGSVTKPLIGVDEAGRGALAGPVVCAAVILHSPIEGLADSKTLTEARRDTLYETIIDSDTEIAVALVGPRYIERHNILKATLYGMRRAVLRLNANTTLPIQVDGNKTPTIPKRDISCIIKGDQKVPAISAASIIAKVTRDRLMTRLHKRYPQYHFAQHKGYGTSQHYQAILENDPCPAHRLSFRLYQKAKLFDHA